MLNLCQIKVCTEQWYIIRTSTHVIYIEKLNTFLRLVKTVLVPYLKIKLDTIPFICYFFKFIRIYILIYIYMATAF